jgi:hypothetical protein
MGQNVAMDSDAREILNYLKHWGQDFISAKEICRRAGTKKRFHEDPNWAVPALMAMVERGLLESDAAGRFRLNPKRKKNRGHWISPDIEKILKDGGIDVESADSGLLADDHSEQL